MKQSQLFTRAVKDLPKDETSYNAQALIRAGFIDKVGAGIYTFLPLGLRVMNKIMGHVRAEINAVSGQEVLMAALTPKDSWQKTGRYDNFDALFKLNGSDKKEYALGATHEEVVTPLAQKFIFSYRELPLAIYQIQTKFRNEKRAKAGLIRGREFSMKDLYSFHTDISDLDRYHDEVKDAYRRIYERLGLGEVTYLTYAAGGAFSKYSLEFQTLTTAGEDHIYICEPCRLAINQEIIEEQKTCPQCGSKKFKEAKAIEVGNIFKLGTRFSEAFSLKYKNQAGGEELVQMGCYGLGISRVMGAIVEVFHDEKGITWPESVAPFKVHLLSLNENEAAEKVYQDLVKQGIEVLYDDRDLGAGEKFAEADLIGCPYRLVISRKTLATSSAELKKRTEEAASLISLDDILSHLK